MGGGVQLSEASEQVEGQDPYLGFGLVNHQPPQFGHHFRGLTFDQQLAGHPPLPSDRRC